MCCKCFLQLLLLILAEMQSNSVDNAAPNSKYPVGNALLTKLENM